MLGTVSLIPLIFHFALTLGCARKQDPQSAFDQAMHSFRTGQVAKAEQEAEAGYQRFRHGDSEWAWRFLLLDADALAWRGMNDRVLDLIASEQSSTPHDLLIRRARVEGAAYTALHLFQEAEKKLLEAEQFCAGSSSPDCIDVLIERGFMEMNRGEFDAGRGLFRDALTMARNSKDTFKEATALLDLGWSALQKEHYDETMEWSNAAYKLAIAIQAERTAQTALGNEGWAYYKLGEHEKALLLLDEAKSRAHKIGATTDEATWLTTSGYIYLDAGQFAKAEQCYKQALDLAQRTTRQDVIDALVSLALVSERSGKLDQARDYAEQTIALVPKDGSRLDVLYPMLVKGHVAAREHRTQEAEKIYREIEKDPKSHVFLKWESEHSLAQLYEDEKKPELASHEYRAALSTFETARSSLKHEESSLPFPANASGIYDDYLHLLVSTGKTQEALRVAEYGRGRNLAEGLGLLQKGTSFRPDLENPQVIARQSGGTILFYWLGEKQSYLWAITRQKTSLFTLPAKSQIDPLVQRYRKALAEQQEFLRSTEADGRELYRTLVGPAEASVPKRGNVFIVPDGSLNLLNFETLLVGDPTPHYWIEDATIADASSLRVLAASHAGHNRAHKLLVFGDAVSPNADYPQLRNATSEIQSIEKHFPPADQRILACERATPTAYLESKPEQYAYIHFVAHGTASRLSPLDSAIVLSKAGAQDDSFKLYAREIIHQPLHAELVVVSTCYGAGARAYSGEGLVGLSWAFLRAGAHNVVGALWEVSDVSTPKLMDELYASLMKGQSPPTALRNAKLSLLRSGSDFRKPFYWAPFQLYTGS